MSPDWTVQFDDLLTMRFRWVCTSIQGNSYESKGFDHGVGHPLLLLYDAKAPSGRKNQRFKGLGHYA